MCDYWLQLLEKCRKIAVGEERWEDGQMSIFPIRALKIYKWYTLIQLLL